MYLIKCLMRWVPIQVILFSMLVITLLASYALKICERPLMTAIMNTDYSQVQVDSKNNIGDYNNALWCILITMSTGINKFINMHIH